MPYVLGGASRRYQRTTEVPRRGVTGVELLPERAGMITNATFREHKLQGGDEDEVKSPPSRWF